jgi:hypothetical protein
MIGLAALVVLLALTTMAAAAAPACPTSGRTITYTYNLPEPRTVTVTKPKDSELCPNMDTGGCCDSIVITGLAEGWKVTGEVSVKFLFTTKYRLGDPKAIQLYSTISVNAVVGPTGIVTIGNICYPPAHNWPSGEIHVDLALLVADANNLPVQGIGQDPNIPGTLGPGMGGWDPVCNTLACTPGYWKTHPEAWLGVKTTDLFSTVFQKTPSFNSLLTMIQATGTNGGGEKAMIRHCSSAYVGSKWVEYQKQYGNLAVGTCPYWAAGTYAADDIIQKVKDAYNGDVSFEAAHQYCAAMNQNSLCGPGGVWTNTTTGVFGGPACLLPFRGSATPGGWK